MYTALIRQRLQEVITNNNFIIPESAVHLGHYVCTYNKDCAVTAAKIGFWRSFNLFKSDYGHTYSFLKGQLSVQYCCCYYCSPLWPLSGDGLDSPCVTWRKALRAIWRIHPMTHCDIITVTVGQPLILSFKSHFVKYINKYISCENGVVKTVVFISISNPMSCSGNNYTLLLNDRNEFELENEIY